MSADNPTPNRTNLPVPNRTRPGSYVEPGGFGPLLGLFVALLLIASDLLIATFFGGGVRSSVIVQLLIGFGEMLQPAIRALAGAMEEVAA